MTEMEIEEKYNTDLRRISSKIYRSLTGESYKKPSAISLAIFRLQQKARADPEKAHPLDYKYWQEKGWNKKKSNYYFNHQSGIGKIILSRIIYGVISLLYVKN